MEAKEHQVAPGGIISIAARKNADACGTKSMKVREDVRFLGRGSVQ